MNNKRLISVIAIIVGVIAVIVAATFATKVLAEDWHGKIGQIGTVQLDPEQCKLGGGGGTNPCYGEPPCDPSIECCDGN